MAAPRPTWSPPGRLTALRPLPGDQAGDGGHGPIGRLGRTELVGAKQVGHDAQHPLHQAAAAHAGATPATFISSGRPMIRTNARATL